MSHLDVDRYANQSRYVGLDARVKLVCTVALVVVAALLTSLAAIASVLGFILVLVLVSGLPLRHVARNYAYALVFILFASLTMLLTSGTEAAFAMFMRISASVLALIILVATTPFFKLLEALRSLRLPRTLCTLIMFTYRFIFVLFEEAASMNLARKARGFGGGRSIFDRKAFATLSATIGMVFVRAHSRASNIYGALLSRGYSGEMPRRESMTTGPLDAALIVLFGIAALAAILLQTGVIAWTL